MIRPPGNCVHPRLWWQLLGARYTLNHAFQGVGFGQWPVPRQDRSTRCAPCRPAAQGTANRRGL